MSGISVVKNCSWIGGVDLNETGSDDGSGDAAVNDATILLSLKSKIQVVRLADKVLEAPVSRSALKSTLLHVVTLTGKIRK